MVTNGNNSQLPKNCEKTGTSKALWDRLDGRMSMRIFRHFLEVA